MLLGVQADWQDVMIAALTLAGVVFNGLVAIYLARAVRVPSGGRIGELAERAHNTAIANNLELRRMNGHGLESASDADEESA